mmetsp:Transcript_20408/g.42020  ORF Transcript_20408/g.42020 Transcript_20408/m.42020 type:complete len:230 (+) Transcript_20408:508-1197(+)
MFGIACCSQRFCRKDGLPVLHNGNIVSESFQLVFHVPVKIHRQPNVCRQLSHQCHPALGRSRQQHSVRWQNRFRQNVFISKQLHNLGMEFVGWLVAAAAAVLRRGIQRDHYQYRVVAGESLQNSHHRGFLGCTRQVFLSINAHHKGRSLAGRSRKGLAKIFRGKEAAQNFGPFLALLQFCGIVNQLLAGDLGVRKTNQPIFRQGFKAANGRAFIGSHVRWKGLATGQNL